MPFKNKQVEAGFKDLHPALEHLYHFVMGLILGRFKKIAIMTSSARLHGETVKLYLGMKNLKTGELYKSGEVPISCHDIDILKILRAFDLRSRMFTPGECQEIQRVINEHWAYDPNRLHKPDDRIKIIAAVPIPFGKLVRTPEGAVRGEADSVMVTTQEGDNYVCHKSTVVKKYHLLEVPDRKLVPKEEEEKEHIPPTINERNDAKKKGDKE